VVGFNVIKSLEQFRCDPTAPSLTIMQAARKIFFDKFHRKIFFFFISENAISAAATPIEEIPLPTDKKSKKKRKEQKVPANLADGTVATTTNEIETTIVDKKTMRKRVKHFLKKHKSASGTPMRPESKLSKIQKSMMAKHIQQYQSVPIIEEVCQRIISIKKFLIDFFSRLSKMILIGGRNIMHRKEILVNVDRIDKKDMKL
jgi:hypothetical protein